MFDSALPISGLMKLSLSLMDAIFPSAEHFGERRETELLLEFIELPGYTLIRTGKFRKVAFESARNAWRNPMAACVNVFSASLKFERDLGARAHTTDSSRKRALLPHRIRDLYRYNRLFHRSNDRELYYSAVPMESTSSSMTASPVGSSEKSSPQATRTRFSISSLRSGCILRKSLAASRP